MSEQRPEAPWVGPAPPPPSRDLPPPHAGGMSPSPPQAAPQAPPPAPSGGSSPLASLERQANISLALSIASIVCGGIILSVIAFVLASNAERKARHLGTTSSDGRIRTAKVVAIVATILWVVIIAAIILGNMSQSS